MGHLENTGPGLWNNTAHALPGAKLGIADDDRKLLIDAVKTAYISDTSRNPIALMKAAICLGRVL